METGGGWYLGFISSVLPIRRCCELWVLESCCSLVTAFGSGGTGSTSGLPAIQPGQTEKVNKSNLDPGCHLAPKPLCKWHVSEQTWLLIGISPSHQCALRSCPGWEGFASRKYISSKVMGNSEKSSEGCVTKAPV